MEQQFVRGIAQNIHDAEARARRDGRSIRDCPYDAANMQIWHLEQWKRGYMEESRRQEVGL